VVVRRRRTGFGFSSVTGASGGASLEPFRAAAGSVVTANGSVGEDSTALDVLFSLAAGDGSSGIDDAVEVSGAVAGGGGGAPNSLKLSGVVLAARTARRVRGWRVRGGLVSSTTG
jgi:hypothetical protein